MMGVEEERAAAALLGYEADYGNVAFWIPDFLSRSET